MRIKLDENLPEDARLAAVGLGHDVDTVLNEGIGGVSDRDVFVAAIREGRFLITLDRGFGDIRHYPPGSHPGIAVIRIESQDPPSVVLAVRNFLSNRDLGGLSGCIVVVRGDLVRVRRPS